MLLGAEYAGSSGSPLLEVLAGEDVALPHKAVSAALFLLNLYKAVTHPVTVTA